jgi:hypothetical protein
MHDIIRCIESNTGAFVFILTGILDCLCNGDCVKSMPIPVSTKKNGNDTDAKKNAN